MWKSIGLRSTMDMYDTHEMFSRYPVDAALAQRLVPAPWRVKVHADGRAVLLVMVQDCGRMVLDAVIPLGRVRFSHIWIEVEGPEELVEPLPGTSRALPTWYWYILPHQSDRTLVRALFAAAGAPAQMVDRIELGARLGRSRSGQVRESAADGYHWTEEADTYEEPDIVTGSHRFYRRYGRLESEAHARCFTHFLGQGTVGLEATAGSSITSLGFGTSLSGSSNSVWFQHCHVRYLVRLVPTHTRTRRASRSRGQEAFIAEPRRIGPLMRPWNSVVDHLMRVPFLPARLIAWDSRAWLSWFAGSLYWLFPAGRARKTLGDRIQTMAAIAAAVTTNSPYCIADTLGEPTGLTAAEIETLRSAADVEGAATFSPRERLAIRYARLISSTPLEFPPEFITDLTALFSEQEIVILAALAAEVNRNCAPVRGSRGPASRDLGAHRLRTSTSLVPRAGPRRDRGPPRGARTRETAACAHRVSVGAYAESHHPQGGVTMVEFMSSTAGRIARAAVGVVLLILAFVVGGVWGWVLGILGVVFVAVGVADVCLLAPLFGKPMRGAEVRASSS